MISLQTNVASLVAQQNLSVNQMFQNQTITQLTSGYRINSSGDDAAGLAVVNQDRDQIAQLTQGVQNGNNGVAQLQIMDGGMSNISQILDRLQTLATESASSSFTGNRATLNNEFQSDIKEIDRQAQSIGLNQGGTFAQNLSVFLGAGNGSQSQANSIVGVNLSNATVDSQSLGLMGVQAVNANSNSGGSTAFDLGGTTFSVQNIVSQSNNQSSLTNGNSLFTFYGPGFGDENGVTVNVNMSGVQDTTTLVNAINTAIQGAGNGTTAAAAAFKAANISASIHTDSSGHQTLAFNSPGAAFEVQADDQMSAALMGNVQTADQPQGKAMSVATTDAATGTGHVASGDTLTISGTNGSAPIAYTFNATDAGAAVGSATATQVASDLNGLAAFKSAGFVASVGGTNSALVITNTRGNQFAVSTTATADLVTALGMSTTGGATSTSSATTKASTYSGNGAYTLGYNNNGTNTALYLNFANFAATTDTQSITISANDASGDNHATTVKLSGTNATDINMAADVINQQLQNSADSTLKQINAVVVNNGGTQRISFVSTLSNYAVSIGTAPSGDGLAINAPPSTMTSQNQTIQAVQVGTGGSADISTQAGAQAAVAAITNAVSALGLAQAAVGKGENVLNYAVNLANSQITNTTVAESNIMDANVAQQAANLSKAQVLNQAAVAAMAQANSAPQAVLSLLRG